MGSWFSRSVRHGRRGRGGRRWQRRSRWYWRGRGGDRRSCWSRARLAYDERQEDLDVARVEDRMALRPDRSHARDDHEHRRH